MESATQSRLSLGRFSLNSMLRRHKRTHSLPETPVMLKSSCESVASTCRSVDAKTDACQWKKVNSTIRAFEETVAPNDEVGGGSGGSGGGGKRSSGSAMRLEHYSSQLGLSKKEKILKVCPCFMVADLLIQGVLIITDRHVCFYSNIFGHRRNKKIKFEDVVQIGKEKVYALFPTGISVRTSVEKVTFSSAKSRDKLLKLLREQCRECSSGRSSGGQGSQTETEASITGSNGITTQSPGTVSSDLLASEGEDHMQQLSPEVQLVAEDAPVLVASVGSLESGSIASWEGRQQPIETSGSQPVIHLATAGELSTTTCTHASQNSTCSGIVLNKGTLGVMAIILVFCGLFVYAFYLTFWLGEIEQQILVAVSRTQDQGPTTNHYSQLDSQISTISSEVCDLQSKIMHMQTVLRNLLMYKGETNSGPCQNGKDCSTIPNSE